MTNQSKSDLKEVVDILEQRLFEITKLQSCEAITKSKGSMLREAVLLRCVLAVAMVVAAVA